MTQATCKTVCKWVDNYVLTLWNIVDFIVRMQYSRPTIRLCSLFKVKEVIGSLIMT